MGPGSEEAAGLSLKAPAEVPKGTMRAWNMDGTVCCAGDRRCTRPTVTGRPGLL